MSRIQGFKKPLQKQLQSPRFQPHRSESLFEKEWIVLDYQFVIVATLRQEYLIWAIIKDAKSAEKNVR